MAEDNVVSLHGGPVSESGSTVVNQGLISDLEYLLEQARAGQVKMVMYSVLLANGDCRAQVLGNTPGIIALGAVAMLNRRVEDLTMQGAQYSR